MPHGPLEHAEQAALIGALLLRRRLHGAIAALEEEGSDEAAIAAEDPYLLALLGLIGALDHLEGRLSWALEEEEARLRGARAAVEGGKEGSGAAMKGRLLR